MILIVLLLCAIYLLFLSAKYFLLHDDFYIDGPHRGGGDMADNVMRLYGKNYKPSSLNDKNIIDKIIQLLKIETNNIRHLEDFKKYYYTPMHKYMSQHGDNATKRFIFNQIDSLLLAKNRALARHSACLSGLKGLEMKEDTDIYAIFAWFSTNMGDLINEHSNFVRKNVALQNTFNYLMSEVPEFAQEIKNNNNSSIIPFEKILNQIKYMISDYISTLNSLYDMCQSSFPKLVEHLTQEWSIIFPKYIEYNYYITNMPVQDKLFELLSKLKFPKIIMEYNRDGDALDVLYILHGTKKPLIGGDIPVIYCICKKIIFYVDMVNNVPVFKSDYILNTKELTIVSQTDDTLVFKKSKLLPEKFQIMYKEPNTIVLSSYIDKKTKALIEEMHKSNIEKTKSIYKNSFNEFVQRIKTV